LNLTALESSVRPSLGAMGFTIKHVAEERQLHVSPVGSEEVSARILPDDGYGLFRILRPGSVIVGVSFDLCFGELLTALTG